MGLGFLITGWRGNQQLKNGCILFFNSPLGSGFTLVIHWANIGTVGQKRSHHFFMAPLGGQNEGSVISFIFRIDVGAACNQLLDNFRKSTGRFFR